MILNSSKPNFRHPTSGLNISSTVEPFNILTFSYYLSIITLLVAESAFPTLDCICTHKGFTGK